jgi:hypothetical protein
MTDHEDDFPTIPPAPALPSVRGERSSTEPASAPVSSVSPEVREIRAGFFNLALKIDAFDKRLAAVEGGVRMVLNGQNVDRDKLDKIAAELTLLREAQEANTAAVDQVASGLRHATDDLRERVERLEHPGNGLDAEA